VTELIWDGKYKDGKKVGPVRIALPFQTVETVNETAQERQLTLDMLYAGRETEWRNRLIWGDKKYVLPSLLPEFAGQVNLIYIDPPFTTGADFSFTTTIPESNESLNKEPSMIEQKAYRDTWGRGLDSFLQWFYETILLLRELLAENGSIYVHCDWRVNSAVRHILDEVFGSQRHGNEIIWHYQSGGRQENRYSKKHDTIYLYNRSDTWIFNIDSIGETRGTAKRNNMKREVDEEGRVYFSIKSAGKIYRYYEDEKLTPPDVWVDISHIQQKDPQRLGYPTQKPEALLERIIKASSNEGDIVLDCFCGSGTTAAVAEKLGRRWITCDLGRFAIQTTRKRLLSIDNVKPFVVQNLGKYERQAWQTAEFSDPTQRASTQLRYRNFILQLYHATPIDGYSWLHGVKGGKLVHVGSVDAPISLGEVRSIVNEFWRVKGKDAGEHTNGIDVLGWDFAFDLNETAKQMAADSNITLSFKRIPREVLEKKAVEQGDIAFYELAALAVNVQTEKKSVSVELQNFFMPPDDVPEDVKNAITHWRQWIDYWAIDWDYREDTFHNQWQSYRTKKQPDMLLKAAHTYEEPGTYTIVIKVIDILGNDTTKAITVEVA
jgi:adenine-specific DNA-methyltransferase